MSDTTKIQWADATFNPWIGCTKVSPGCAHCYAENTTRARVLRSQGHETWGKGKPRSRTSQATWRNPLKWEENRSRCRNCGKMNPDHYNLCKSCGYPCDITRPRIFPSLCDWLDDEVPIEWLADFLKLIHDTPNLDWLLLTKRPENYFNRIEDAVNCLGFEHAEAANAWSDPDEHYIIPHNVWIGTSVEDQPRADERIPELLKIPTKVRFLSVEPLLGAVDLKLTKGIHWVIIGGESGPGARATLLEDIYRVFNQCVAANVRCYVKQLGSKPFYRHEVGSGKGGTLLPLPLKHPKGGDMAEWPADLRVRQFPTLAT